MTEDRICVVCGDSFEIKPTPGRHRDRKTCGKFCRDELSKPKNTKGSLFNKGTRR